MTKEQLKNIDHLHSFEKVKQAEQNKIVSELVCGQKSCGDQLQQFLIITKEHNQEAIELSKEIAIWLENQGKKAIVSRHHDDESLKEMAIECQIALILGGDGTMLGVARALYEIDIPLLGINFGRVGFLTDISPSNWQQSLKKLLDGAYEIQLYTPLQWEIIRNNVAINNGIAINDVVIARSHIAKAISIGLFIDNIFLSELFCDGLICSAPLGATAYAAAAHGPLAFPSLDAHILTPISPFAGAFPPLVLPKESLVKIEALKGEIALTIDGQDCYSLQNGDAIHVQSAHKRIPMYVQNQHWFWQRLVDRHFIMPGPGKYTR